MWPSLITAVQEASPPESECLYSSLTEMEVLFLSLPSSKWYPSCSLFFFSIFIYFEWDRSQLQHTGSSLRPPDSLAVAHGFSC